MRWIAFLIALVGSGIFLYYGHFESAGSLPPVVKFFNPYNGFWRQAENTTLPKRFFRAETDADITIGFDDRLVPHIYASTYEDAVFAQGILHACFRLWQMDMTSRAATGRLSEILGARTLPYDRSRRALGLPVAARHIESTFPAKEQTQRTVSSYIEGVNTYIAQIRPEQYPLEYKLLNFEPREWTRFDVASVVTAMTYDLCFKNEDVAATSTYHSFGSSFYTSYYPEWNPLQSPIIQKDYKSIMPPAAQDQLEIAQLGQGKEWPIYDWPDPDNGSNNWAIKGAKTLKGAPILANDPHLRLRLPSVWYELHIHLPDRDIYGVSFPGIPGVVLGFNDYYAWGSTNVGHDVADWFMPKWHSPGSKTYYHEGEWKQAVEKKELIPVKDMPDDTLIYWETELGRIPYPTDTGKVAGMGFQWVPLTPLPGGTMHTFIEFNLGSNYRDFTSALPNHQFPAQNFVFAGRSDTIAMHVQGALPLRTNSNGKLIPDQCTTSPWQTYVPQTALPFETNPARGFVSSANQHSTNPSYPFPYSGYFEDYRGRTLDSFLKSSDSWSMQSVKKLQLSSFSLKAEEAIRAMKPYLDSSQFALDPYWIKLKDWNFECESDISSPSIFALWWDLIKHYTLDEWDNSHSPLEDFVLIDRVRKNPYDTIFDRQESPAIRESAKDIVITAWQAAIDSFKSLEEPVWKDMKKTQIMHMAGIEAFSSAIIDIDGSADALNATKRFHGPSWRMIVSMGSEIEAFGIYPGGQSGNPGSYYYDNFVSDWANGDYYKLELIPSPEDERILQRWKIESKP